MKRKVMTADNAGLGRQASQRSINYAMCSNDELKLWEIWFAEHNEQDYETPRERSYFRVNKAQCHAEVKYRATGMPF